MEFKNKHSLEKEKIDNELSIFLDSIDFKNTFQKSLWNKTKQHIKQGGKRLRPVALLMAYSGISDQKKDIYQAAISVELYHASTLIHDDIIDEDTKRRNSDTIFEWVRKNKRIKDDSYEAVLFKNKTSRFATTQSILAGNIVNNIAYQPLINSSFKTRNEAINILIDTAIKVNEGQILDTLLETKKPSEKEYLNMILKKTGELFIGSIMIGLKLAQATKEQEKNMYNFAKNIALAFQIQDDLMDINPNSKKGHVLGSDIKQGKMTLLAIKALEKNPKFNLQKNIKTSIEFFKTCGAIDYCKTLANKKINDGKKFLKQAKLSKESEEYFTEFANYMLNRNI